MQIGWNDATQPFKGANVILFLGDTLTVLLRDDKPEIAWPNYWDLPGGLREPGETPAACAIRETREETALCLELSDFVWAKRFEKAEELPTWFLAAHLPLARAVDLKLGDEGQALEQWPAERFLQHPKAIPHFRDRLREYLEQREG